MFFELASGQIVNLNHIVLIPAIGDDDQIKIDMSNGDTMITPNEDAHKICKHLRPFLINPS